MPRPDKPPAALGSAKRNIGERSPGRAQPSPAKAVSGRVPHASGSSAASARRALGQSPSITASGSGVFAVEPHDYVPSILHMGDCAICGHLQGDAIHQKEAHHAY